ncbi:hypothetical protein DENSPDRAFT_833134 [Dentipellis sp. KUC8613]|nr:hypothetical protein DENSPDRAFT_833134 [Dentipellis sp. KUC8613]
MHPCTFHLVILTRAFRPKVPPDIQKNVLFQLISELDGVADYHLGRERGLRKRKAKKLEAGRKGKKRKLDPPSTDAVDMDVGDDEGRQNADEGNTVDASSAPAPPVLEHITVGINQVTKKLEDYAKSFRTIISTPDPDGFEQHLQPHDTIRAIFVCRADVDPPALINHLPQLVAACNSLNYAPDADDVPKTKTLLVPLGVGAESALASAIGFRRVSVIAIHNTFPNLAGLEPFLNSVPVLNASWLLRPGVTTSGRSELEPTHIKQLRTTTPKDMRAAKEERLRRRAEAKERKRNRMTVESISIPVSKEVDFDSLDEEGRSTVLFEF